MYAVYSILKQENDELADENKRLLLESKMLLESPRLSSATEMAKQIQSNLNGNAIPLLPACAARGWMGNHQGGAEWYGGTKYRTARGRRNTKGGGCEEISDEREEAEEESSEQRRTVAPS